MENWKHHPSVKNKIRKILLISEGSRVLASHHIIGLTPFALEIPPPLSLSRRFDILRLDHPSLNYLMRCLTLPSLLYCDLLYTHQVLSVEGPIKLKIISGHHNLLFSGNSRAAGYGFVKVCLVWLCVTTRELLVVEMNIRESIHLREISFFHTRERDSCISKDF